VDFVGDGEGAAVWFGSEANGLTPEAMKIATRPVHVSMSGMVESLNLSVAAGMILSELRRQRMASSLDYSLSIEAQAALVTALAKEHRIKDATTGGSE
jgi:tRNA C32,U32 (ribose-2'-O)-methylase TrmJ